MDWDLMWSTVGTHWHLYNKIKHQNMSSLANAFVDNHRFKMIVQQIGDLGDMVHIEAAKDE